ncbi:sensor histidine kinase [Phaeobacter gallaeciensis]|uniref:histidine kinase n=1 Tax=Phaeobacter gallaeciensis TaxID=60890 RepID=A0AAC9Z8W3_9RHOB|nr:ATP-binding protein [Phaeobacter gallaeciensis]AHD09577.1 His Kinase A domain protein/PAS fold protein/Histidine kinase-, DNA gyrase B-, and HSP90-like ATPase [Phaeobacter gallaeciensis DSM 26640]ATE92842.1 phosphate regulon sensor protein phoR-like protein [Phaeobacter gallaeciensis]ATE97336.1 phosphate regulon sensor protein phoR-like protein [Phaeobacter gallaeciensis]ATF01507.1 phosphate regulon sensor protein phoR-like protein [Phaeobacter gallaeciensis]ATF05887.1 phosphate regulon sen
MTQDLIDGFMEAIPLPAVLVDQSERFIAANAAATTLLGNNLVGRHFATILRQPNVATAIERCLYERSAKTARHLSNDGAQDTTFEVALRYIPGIGAVNGGAALISLTDITEREQASQMRRDFVANVSHELRTPLTALMGFIETLRGPARDDAAARDRFLQIMQDEANRMNRLVGDLLSLNRVESEERVRPRAQLDLGAHLASTLKSLEPVAEAADVDLTLEIPEEPTLVTGDPDQLQQVFTNLVENAIKYGGDQVTLRLRTRDRDPAVRAAAVRVEVIDNGAGIDPVHLPRLTERFYRVDTHRSREQGGTGLGLAIVKHIINRHRGRMRVESAAGTGTVFTVILPR